MLHTIMAPLAIDHACVYCLGLQYGNVAKETAWPFHRRKSYQPAWDSLVVRRPRFAAEEYRRSAAYARPDLRKGGNGLARFCSL